MDVLVLQQISAMVARHKYFIKDIRMTLAIACLQLSLKPLY